LNPSRAGEGRQIGQREELGQADAAGGQGKPGSHRAGNGADAIEAIEALIGYLENPHAGLDEEGAGQAQMPG
jgi:hypothetical protein